MGLMAVVPTLGLYIEERFGFTGPELQAWTGWTFAAAPLTAACIGPLWGVLGDRYGRKPMVVRAGLGIGVATALMPLAPTPMTLLLLRVFQGAFAGYMAPALALGTADVDKGRQGVVIGRLQLAMALGTLAGPAIGAEIAHAFSRAAVFYFTSGASVVATMTVIALAKEPPAVAGEDSSGAQRRKLGAAMRADLGHLLGNRVFLGLLLCIFLMRFGLHAVEPYVALWIPDLGALPILERWSGPERGLAQTVAAAFIILAVTQLLLTTAWGRLADRFGPLRCLALSGVSLGVVFFFTSGVRAIESFFVLRSVAAVFMAGGMTLAYTAVARRVAVERRSLAFSLVQSCLQFGLASGPVVADWLARSVGSKPEGAAVAEMSELYVIGGVCLTVSGVGMILVRWYSPPREA